MSDYERKAWDTLLDDIANRSTGGQGRFGRLAGTATSQAKDVALKAKNGLVDKVPVAEKAFDAVDGSIQKAMAGLHTAFVERGLNSVRAGSIFETFAAEGADVSSYDSIRELDLRVCDRSVPRRKEKYVLLAAGQGAATSLAVTGATVSSTVSGGTTLGVGAGAIVVDVTAVMVGMGRIVALVAAHYGYDVREPDEQVFAAGVLSYSSAGSAAEKKAASLAALSRLTQDMMRQATWKQLQQHQLVNVIQTIVTSLGFNLTKKKLAQAVPVAGAVINGGLNARLAQNTFNRAQAAYRLRFVTEKYGLDASQWAPEVVNSESTQAPLIDAIVESELATNSVDGGSPSGQRHPSDVGGGGTERASDELPQQRPARTRMTSLIAWLDASTEDQRRMREIVNLFSERESRDELGIGQVRDALSDMLWPGTSTLFTRARYFLFIPPWCFRAAAEARSDIDKATGLADQHERRLIRALVDAGEKDGVIGANIGAALKNLPSTLYWGGGMRTHGIVNEATITRDDAIAAEVERATRADPRLRKFSTSTRRRPGMPVHSIPRCLRCRKPSQPKLQTDSPCPPRAKRHGCATECWRTPRTRCLSTPSTTGQTKRVRFRGTTRCSWPPMANAQASCVTRAASPS